MQFKNTPETYGLISKMFHWSMALIIMGLLLVGLYMEGLEPSPDKYQLYGLHKSFGLLILWLIGLRILWRGYNTTPKPHEAHQTWEKVLAKIVHVLLYVSMIGMPLTGWLMSSAGGHAVAFFGLQIPALVGEDKSFSRLMNETHSILAFILIGIIALHAAGALKHHFIDKDNTLKRMMLKVPFVQTVMPYMLVVILGLFFGGIVYFLLSEV